MPARNVAAMVEDLIEQQWQSHCDRQPSIWSVDVAKLENDLRGHLSALISAGL